MRISIFGAGGATGRELVSQAAERGHTVTAAEHEWPFQAPPRDGVTHVTADVMKDELEPYVEGRDAVVSALGLGPSPRTILDPPPLYTESSLRISQAMGRAGVRRLVVISAAFVEQRDVWPLWFRASVLPAMRQVYRQMGDMERILRARDHLDWTAVRSGWLLDRPKTEDYQVADRRLPPGTLRTRHGDLAHFILQCLEEDSWVGGTPAVARQEPLRYLSPFMLLEELR